MTDRRRHPWLLSLGLHILLGSLVLAIGFQSFRPAPAAIRMRLVMAARGSLVATGQSGAETWWTPPSPRSSRTEPDSPVWQGGTSTSDQNPARIPAPASLDELLGPAPSPPVDQPSSSTPAAETPGWSNPGGTGYTPPPLPPPQFTPPGGAHWTLSFRIPGAGGFPLDVDGTDSGHPDLDQWLTTYLRTVTFPPSLDGSDYQLRWVLNLETGKPR